jgi:hypothetical protein
MTETVRRADGAFPVTVAIGSFRDFFSFGFMRFSQFKTIAPKAESLTGSLLFSFALSALAVQFSSSETFCVRDVCRWGQHARW